MLWYELELYTASQTQSDPATQVRTLRIYIPHQVQQQYHIAPADQRGSEAQACQK